MNYRFENIYTQAELIRWQSQAASKLESHKMSLTTTLLVFIIQFCLWAPILYFISPLDLSFMTKALGLFTSYFCIGTFYERTIHSHISARFDKKLRPSPEEISRAIINIDGEKIRTRENHYEIIFNWSDIQEVEDNEKTVFLLTKTGYCIIPARCFPGFLEKDAFVRTCREKISGYTEQGAYFA